VVIAATRVGLAALAITDHDTVSALAVARPEAERWGVELIAGVELTCAHDGRELHILGYFFRENDRALREAAAALRAGREQRLLAMVARLEELGFTIDLRALRTTFPRANLGRRHLADFLARTRQVPSPRLVFERYLGDGGPACVEKPRLDTACAIALIQGAGGVAALAHPPSDFRDCSLRSLVDQGLRAVEVDGPGFSSSKSQRMRASAIRLGLTGIAGSDFHSHDRPSRWVGAITTRMDVVEELRVLAGQSGFDH
jgi:predicted metal-dependent phosphoesterase TrpH